MNIRLPRSSKAVGLTVLAGLLVVALYAFNQQRVLTTLSSGEDLKADFVRDYQVVPYSTIVKVAGVQVGMVTGTTQSAGDHTLVDMKLTGGTLDKLGNAPRAIIRPTTILGGKYYVELVRDGAAGALQDGSTIPLTRTAVPVELDSILSTITPKQASQGIQRTIGSLAATLDKHGRSTVQSFVSQAPQTLRPLASTLAALEGDHSGTDLTKLVSGLQSTAYALTRQQGQVGAILDHLDQTSSALANVRVPLASMFAQGPSTLASTQAGLAALAPTLDKLQATSTSFIPAAQQLGRMLTALDPVIKEARPVIADARSVAADARPLVQNAVPTVAQAHTILNDVQGPVLDRVRGPLMSAVMSPWHGTGYYAGGGNDHPLYKETGYLLANIADVFKFHDHNQAMGRLMAGVSLKTLGGIVQMSLPQYLASLGIGSLGSSGSVLKSPLAGASSSSSQTPSRGLGTGLLSNLGSLLGGLQ